MKLLLFQQNVTNSEMAGLLKKSFIFSVSLLSLFANPANAGLLDWFKKDSCKAYSDYTCKQLENSSYNVYFYWPSDKEEYLGQRIASAAVEIWQAILHTRRTSPAVTGVTFAVL